LKADYAHTGMYVTAPRDMLYAVYAMALCSSVRLSQAGVLLVSHIRFCVHHE